jgi:hypothetical protein
MLKVYFVPHTNEAFTTQFDELFSWSYVLAMEFAYSNGDQDVEKYWNEVSRGVRLHRASALSPQEEFTDGILGHVQLTFKPVEFERSPVKKSEMERTNDIFDEARKLWKSGEIDKALNRLDVFEREFASHIDRRDRYYSRQLQVTVKKYSEKNILCLRGVLHSETLPRLLRDLGVGFSSYLFTETYVHPLAEEVTANLLQSQPISRDTLMRRHIEQDLLAGRYEYKTKLAIKEKVAAMKQAEIEEYVRTRH